MSTTEIPDILAHVFIDRIAWFMRSGDVLIGRGVAMSIGELRGVQVRAGILSVVLSGLPCAETFAGEWRPANEKEAAELQKFFALTR